MAHLEFGLSSVAAMQKIPGWPFLCLQHSVADVMQDAVVMFIGCVMLAVATGTTANGWVIMYAVAQLVFGFGVGGIDTLASFCI